jgi:hypothetical protein
MNKNKGMPFIVGGQTDYNDNVPARVKPNDTNATGVLVNLALTPRDKWYQMPVWITDIETGYQLGVEVGQGRGGRTIYPHNISQDNILLTGVTPNQEEYDKLVEFCTRHHQTVLEGGPAGFLPMRLKVFPYVYNTGILNKDGSNRMRVGYEPWLYDVIVANVEAGHERYQYARPYRLELLVANDYLQDQVEVQAEFNDALRKRYIQNIIGKNEVVAPPTVREIGAPGGDVSNPIYTGPDFQQIINQEFPDSANILPNPWPF